jgi:hypothetical protein
MLLFYYINLIKLEMIWLSKKVGMTYNLDGGSRSKTSSLNIADWFFFNLALFLSKIHIYTLGVTNPSLDPQPSAKVRRHCTKVRGASSMDMCRHGRASTLQFPAPSSGHIPDADRHALPLSQNMSFSLSEKLKKFNFDQIYKKNNIYKT